MIFPDSYGTFSAWVRRSSSQTVHEVVPGTDSNSYDEFGEICLTYKKAEIHVMLTIVNYTRGPWATICFVSRPLSAELTHK